MGEDRRARLECGGSDVRSGGGVADGGDDAVRGDVPDRLEGAVELGGDGHLPEHAGAGSEERIDVFSGWVEEEAGFVCAVVIGGQERSLEVCTEYEGVLGHDGADRVQGAGEGVDGVRDEAENGAGCAVAAVHRQRGVDLVGAVVVCAVRAPVPVEVDEAGHEGGVTEIDAPVRGWRLRTGADGANRVTVDEDPAVIGNGVRVDGVGCVEERRLGGGHRSRCQSGLLS
ncbi:hypothetical protein [Curtobacterium sp. VKM Ac-1376]|uniref:hypothetical protein n=1 Tax=Curtobacterium sp. VKM Ac-1376 TaxID=123312 RepID=UPI00188BEF0C|nr:hypothetical protein [Curtobacterium sp. VKM Ac-1376]MBF4616231.1 hypothetical protein [Curtobacterium sp. VKM Ac-1376]